MRTPKERFIASSSKAGWEKITGTTEFEDAVNAALLHMQSEMADPVDVSKSWDQGVLLAGARRYIKILAELHLPEEPRKPQRLPNLKMPDLR